MRMLDVEANTDGRLEVVGVAADETSYPCLAYSENVVGAGGPAANRGILRKTRTVITRSSRSSTSSS